MTDLTAKELALARQHPRGTELRTLGPFREALNDPSAYAALPERDRDVNVRWAATRCAIRDAHGVDADPANLADPLIPAATLRAHVIGAERRASGSDLADDEPDLLALVARIRRGAERI